MQLVKGFALSVRIFSSRPFVLVFLVLIHCSGYAVTYIIDESPMDLITFLGYKAKFYCSSQGPGLIYWFNGDKIGIHHLPSDYNISFKSTSRSDGVDGDNSTLCVIATEVTNGTLYRCGILDIFSNVIVNYSVSAKLMVQGRPLPPNGLRVYYSNKIIGLKWNRSFTLFDDTRSAPTLRYIIYGYSNDSATLSDQDEYFYKNETTLLMHKIFTDHINVKACGLYAITFSVSAKFEEVGEGNMTDPEKISNLPEKSMQTCESDYFHHTSFSIVFGVTIGFTILFIILCVILITCFTVAITISIRQHSVKTVTNSEESIKEKIQLGVSNSATTPSSDLDYANSTPHYETIDELTSKEFEDNIIIRNNSNTAHNATSRDDGITVLYPNCAYETVDEIKSREDDLKMDPNCSYGTLAVNNSTVA